MKIFGNQSLIFYSVPHESVVYSTKLVRIKSFTTTPQIRIWRVLNVIKSISSSEELSHRHLYTNQSDPINQHTTRL